MRAYEKVVASDGKEVMLFPFEYMYISQGEGGSYSHENTYNIDFLGYGANGRVYNCPFYAPCTLECVAIWDVSSNTRVYQSTNQVHLADGTLDYVTICFTHDDNPPHTIGDRVSQGQLLGRTGTTGQTTGDHIHSCCGRGTYQGYTYRQSTIDPSKGHYDLTNRIHYYDCCYVNDTHLVHDESYPWKTYGGATLLLKSKFPWVLYARRLRNKHN